MNELDEIQAFMAEQLRARRALPKDSTISARASELIQPSGSCSPVERLEIYREQFWLRHTSSLVEDFPGLSGILGQAAWARLIEGYLEVHPLDSFDLRDLGLALPRYVARQSTLIHHELCSDMARLELCHIEVFDAADAAPISSAAVAAVAEDEWEQARIEFHPSLRLIKTSYPVAALRRRLIEAPEDAENLLIPERQSECLLLFRRELQTCQERISEGAYALLLRLTQGAPLVAACQRAQAEVPAEAAQIEETLGAWFRAWAGNGLVIALHV